MSSEGGLGLNVCLRYLRFVFFIYHILGVGMAYNMNASTKNILTKIKVKVSGALTMFGTGYVADNRFCTFHFPCSFQIPLVAFQIPLVAS